MQINQTTQLCNGTISAIVTDSKNNPLTNVKVYSNNVFNGSVDIDGSRSINYTNVNCGSSQSITIKCADDTNCDTKSSSIDSNNDYDSLTFTCNICVNKTDLSIATKDVTIKSQGNKHNITALVNVEKVSANNVVIDFRGQNLKNDITQNETKTISVSQYVNQNVSVLWDLNSTDFISITVDFKNSVAEIDESNNYVRKAVRPATKAYIEVTTGYPVLENTIKNFLGQYIEVVTSGQEVNIYVGRKNSNTPKDMQTIGKENTRWGLINNIVNFNSKSEGLPYNGLVVKDGTNIYVFGNEIDGDLAALRKLVDNQEFYFSKSVPERIDYVSEEDLGGLFVFDYLHTDENQPSHRKNTATFGKVVENVLNSDVSTLAIKRVLTYNDNTSLRIKHINTELGPKFKEFANPQPVVLARGLWSNLFTWENLGLEIARGVGTNKPRDTWLIEITGGPNTECDTCPNYNFSELTDYYWPALISGIQAYAGQNNITYIGFSNGCRTALRSLEKYQNTGKVNAGYYFNGSDWVLTNLTAKPRIVDTFVAVGCPGIFLGNSPFAQVIDDYGNNVAQFLISRSHVNSSDVGRALLQQCGRYSKIFDPIKRASCFASAEALSGGDKISYNLANNYNYWVRNGNGSQVGTGVNLNNFLMIYGTLRFRENIIGNSDGIVSVEDSENIDTVININKTHGRIIRIRDVYHSSTNEHQSLPDTLETRNEIRNFINEVN